MTKQGHFLSFQVFKLKFNIQNCNVLVFYMHAVLYLPSSIANTLLTQKNKQTKNTVTFIKRQEKAHKSVYPFIAS